MKVLILCNKPPYPPSEGGPIAMNMIIEGLEAAGHAIKVLAFNTNKTNVDIASIPQSYIKKTRIELIPIDLGISPFKAFLNLFSSRSFHVERFISKDFEKRLIEILQEEKFDVVLFEMLYMSPYLPIVRKYSEAVTILRAHNIEHLIWQRVAETSGQFLKKIYLLHLVKTLKKYETEVIREFDGIAPITSKDAEFFRSVLPQNHKTKIEAIPFGVDLIRFPDEEAEFEFPSFFSIGAMNWMPNVEGMRWFLNEVWPGIIKKFPHISYYIAGRHIPEWLNRCKRPGVHIVGEVKDALDFMNSKAVMVVPLLSGSGIRIKIIEGMAAGNCIISTSIGAEGIHYTNGENILIADTREEFIIAFEKCLNRDFCKKTGKNARKLIEEEYNRKQIISKLISFFEKAGA